jgi:hypothetical protein
MNPKNRTFLGALAYALKSFFLSFSSLVHVADEAIGMLDKSVKTARLKQLVDINANMADYASQVETETALRRAEMQLNIDEFTSRTPRHAELFNTARDQIRASLEKELALLEKEREE